MPRHTIYLPDELDLELRTYRGEINISKVCASALRAELAGRTSLRSIEGIFAGIFRNTSPLEERLISRFGLRQAITPTAEQSPAETVGQWAGILLSETLYEGVQLALGGGTQIWEIARRLESRKLGVSAWAVGFGHVDRELPHLHPNALVTLLSMLYGARTKAMLVGAPDFHKTWHLPTLFPNVLNEVRRVIVGSCGIFDADSPYARLLGDEMTDFLVEENVIGDFLGVFIAPDGRVVEPYAPSMTVSHLGSSDLQQLAKRDDTMVMLTAAGGHKARLIRQILALGLCNAVVIDEQTAAVL